MIVKMILELEVDLPSGEQAALRASPDDLLDQVKIEVPDGVAWLNSEYEFEEEEES